MALRVPESLHGQATGEYRLSRKATPGGINQKRRKQAGLRQQSMGGAALKMGA